MLVTPYNTGEEKKQQVRTMFNQVAHKYDFLNRLLSFGIDKSWRKKTINELAKENPKLILDVATGTADLAIAASKINPDKIIGVDISENMLQLGREKVTAPRRKSRNVSQSRTCKLNSRRNTAGLGKCRTQTPGTRESMTGEPKLSRAE